MHARNFDEFRYELLDVKRPGINVHSGLIGSYEPRLCN
jgi:hypothetical protein